MPAIAELSVADWHRLNRLLEAARALEPAARSEWLRTVASQESDLLPLLEQLLSPRDLTETAQFAPLPARVWAELPAPTSTEQSGHPSSQTSQFREVSRRCPVWQMGHVLTIKRQTFVLTLANRRTP